MQIKVYKMNRRVSFHRAFAGYHYSLRICANIHLTFAYSLLFQFVFSFLSSHNFMSFSISYVQLMCYTFSSTRAVYIIIVQLVEYISFINITFSNILL